MKSIYSKKAKKIKFFLAFLKVGATGFEPATTSSQNRSATGLRYTPLLNLPKDYLREMSGRQDSNLRPPVPKTGALPGCATPRLFLYDNLLSFRASIISDLRLQRYNIFFVSPNF